MKKKKRFLSLVIVGLIILALVLFSTSTFLNKNQRLSVEPSPIPSIFETPYPTATPTATPIPTRIPPTRVPTQKQLSLDELFAKYGAQYNVDPNVLRKIAGCESGFDPNQITGDYAGLFQFASFAWKEARGRIGLNDDLNLRFNAEESIKTAAFEINYKGTSGWSDCD